MATFSYSLETASSLNNGNLLFQPLYVGYNSQLSFLILILPLGFAAATSGVSTPVAGELAIIIGPTLNMTSIHGSIHGRNL